ncbi:MAG: YjbQ family protein [Candidatus Lokiarchaeota archaeon]|nr:YjbQ family protein [Candidatus Lokiarchaeota archaeon]
MSERLYQPDFRSIFGANYANAFIYGQLDSLVWPIFSEIEPSNALTNLLKLENDQGKRYFYNRKISLEDEKIELVCSNIKYGLVQAMDLHRDYGINNEDVLNVVKTDPNLFKAILSFDLNESAINSIKTIQNQIPVVGVVIYPSFLKLDITDGDNENFNELIDYCKENNLFLKIDIGNSNLPDNYTEYSTYDKIKSFLSRHSNIITILSGLDISGDFNLYYQLLKLYNNVWIEIDPRNFGGMTPTSVFSQLFSIQGLVQNLWHRITIGSATPTLEISQMVRGFLEATDVLNFSQKNILRSWGFRNLNRLNSSKFFPNVEPARFYPIQEINEINRVENNNELNLTYKIKLRSYAITQLLYITDLIERVLNLSLEVNPNLKNGELVIKPYHTTVSLIMNEHEFGNYLDLHYMFAEISSKNSSQFLHTVSALENRADFNHYDHELASTYGNRQLILPIVDKKLEIGGRENYYTLVTFGPRTFYINIKIKLIKEY